MIIAIDGPAGSGKSSTARAVARRLGYFYLDTGAMYRAIALRFLAQGLEPVAENVSDAVAGMHLELRSGTDGLHVLLDGEDVSEAIRTEEATAMSSKVSSLRAVRERLVEEQRRLARIEVGRGRGVVLEGRDIGTVVFPNAELKVFLTADIAVRARRRAAQVGSVDPAALERELAVRDARDSGREESPLRAAPDAVQLDTTDLAFNEQVARIVTLAGERVRG